MQLVKVLIRFQSSVKFCKDCILTVSCENKKDELTFYFSLILVAYFILFFFCILLQELEYFRGQHRAAMNQLDVSAQEASTLRSKYGDLLNDNQR